MTEKTLDLAGFEKLGSLHPLTVLAGPSLFDRRAALEHALELFRRACPGGEVKSFSDGPADLSRALQETAEGGFFRDAVLVLLRGGSFAAAHAAPLLSWAEDPPPNAYVVVSPDGLTPASPFLRKLAGSALLCFFREPRGKAFRERAAALVRSRGLALDPAAAALLFGAFEGDLAALDAELAKIALFVAPRRTVSLNDAAAVSSARALANRFELVEKVVRGSTGEALELLERILREGEQPHALFSTLTTELRKVLRAAGMLDAGAPHEDVFEKLSVRFYRDRFLARVHAARSRWKTGGVLSLLLEAEREMKTSSRPPEAVLRGVVCALCA